MDSAVALRTRLGEHASLVADFLAVFARFEYALKHAGYVLGNDGDVASADWDRFADEVEGALDKDRLRHVAGYLIDAPPLKQVVHAGALSWDQDGYKDAPDVMRRVLVLLRRVRNNLFHGAKFHSFHAPDNERDAQLLKAGLALMEEVMTLEPAKPVRAAFFDGHASAEDFANGG